VRRALRLLVGAVVAVWLLGQLALAVQWFYANYAQHSEAGLMRVLEYLFREDEQSEPERRRESDLLRIPDRARSSSSTCAA
jgi:hypothetical protein